MIHQLNPPLPVITPKGKALAHVVIDMGIEHDLQWICFQDATGECWTWSNPQIRAQINITLGRDYISPFYHPSEVAFKKEADEDEEDEDEDEDEEIDWKAAYDEKDEEHSESRAVIIELRQEINKLTRIKSEVTLTLLNLYNDDQIHPNKREQVRELLFKSDELKDGFDGRIISKSPSNQNFL
jgi:hypothetical protein